MLSALTDLGTETSSDKRRALLGRVSDLFYNSGRDYVAEGDLRLFADVVKRLLKDVDTAGRATFSSIIARDERTPHDVALALANDEAEVAAPILESSPLLSDDDLVAIASSQSLGHRLAISKRENVTVRVTDFLVDFGELEVMESLLENTTAALSAKSYDRIADSSTATNGLRERICLRGDVPVAVANKILPFLDARDRAKMQALIDKNSGELNELVRGAIPALSAERSDRAKRRLEIKFMAGKVESNDLPMDEFLSNLVADRQPLDLALGLSELSLLPERQIANAIMSTEAEPLALIAKALEVGTECYEKLDAFRRDSMKLSSETPPGLLENYAKLDKTVAQRVLRFVNVRTSLAATG